MQESGDDCSPLLQISWSHVVSPDICVNTHMSAQSIKAALECIFTVIFVVHYITWNMVLSFSEVPENTKTYSCKHVRHGI